MRTQPVVTPLNAYRAFAPVFELYAAALSVIAGAVVATMDLDAVWLDGAVRIARPEAHWIIIALNAASVMLIHAAGVALDHIAHYDNDRLHRPGRPLPRGLVTVAGAWRFYALSTALGIGLAAINLGREADGGLPTGFLALSTAILYAGLTAAYRLRFHDTPFFAPLLTGLRQTLAIWLGLLSTPTPLTGSLIVDSKLWAPAVAVGFYAHALSWLSLQDASAQKSTLGESIELMLILGIAVLSAAHWIWGALPMIGVAVALFGAGILSMRSPGQAAAHRLYRIGVGSIPIVLSSMMLLAGGPDAWPPGVVGLLGFGVLWLIERRAARPAADAV